MGSQLTKTGGSSSSSSQPQSLSNYQSLRSSPIHTAQQRQQSSKIERQQQRTTIPKNIVIVNRGPNKDPNIQDIYSKLPPEPLLKPLIAFGQLSSNFIVTSDQPRLSVLPFVEIGKLFDQNLKQAAETVANEQQKIIERIRLFEQQSAKLSQHYSQDKQRRFNKAVENFGKFDEIQSLVDRCENDIEQLLTTFAKLNSALPELLCLENFQPPC
ncbi:Loss of heterozygosity 12 chromosomal region 1 protein-like protein [Euroglyphus maynei]|uniref:BLOC-1-related complex subunit 5 n=1 Tax=Euroglyphus maynei TaxID=6958 RepID=A0A1Y3B519_EURMA|nr:Loss of heterozygosity 12 chromosomal region 1 protein-like protein [Euroglyphus maynei]